MSVNRFPSVLVVPIAVLAAWAAGCNLADPLDGTRPPTDSPDADAGPTDANGDMNVPDDVDEDDAGVDMGGEDMPPNEDTGPDMPAELTVAEFFDRYIEEYCTALERLDLQFNDFYWWQSLDDCTATLNALLGTEVVFLTYDAAMDRVTLDQQTAAAALSALAAVEHPTDFDELGFNDLFTPESAPYEACASDNSCIDGDDVSYSCLKPSSTDCEGLCAPFSKRCGESICLADEYCESTNNCVPQKADGETCVNNDECQKLCLSAGAGSRVCGALDIGESCVMNPNGCRAGLFCDSSLATPSCRARVADGENCSVDNACLSDSFCDGGMCTPMDEGTACRNNVRCPDGLRCVRINTVDPDRGCFAERAEGEPCVTDAMCPQTHFCDSTQNPSVCEPKGGIGEACRSSDECSGQLTCRRTDFMSPGTCEQWTWGLGEGETCFEAAAVCSWGLYCEKDGPDSRRGTCTMRTRPAAGESCLQPLECQDSYCDSASDQCEPQGVIGEACASGSDCRSLVCDADTASCISRDDVCP